MIKESYFMKKRIAIDIILSALVMTLCTGCSKKEETPTISMEPKVITINSENGNYKRAIEDIPEEEIEEVVPEAEEDEVQDHDYMYDAYNKIYSRDTANPDEIVLRFVGDICFYDDFSLMSEYRSNGSDINNRIDASLMALMRDADLFMANNEFAYSNRGAPIEGKKYAFRSKPENVEILNEMGADIVSLANNHAYDWGPDALLDTFDTLNAARVPFVGAGRDIEDAMKPAYFMMPGAKISYVSATQIERLGNPDTKEATESSPGVLRTLDPTKACQVISEAKANSDFCIMYVHWGSENTDLVEASQRDLAKKYVEAGADLIIGDHSHCLQGIDYIGDVPVFYSLGNYWFNSKTVDTGIAEIVIDNTSEASIRRVRFIPAIQRGCRTNEVSSEESTRILTYLQGISDYAEIDLTTGEIRKSDSNHNIQGGMNTSPTKKVEEAAPADATAATPVEVPAE